jgi:hypothetical protein
VRPRPGTPNIQMMSRHDPDSEHFRRELRFRLTVLTIAAVSAFVIPIDGTDRAALLVALTATTVYRLRTVHRGGPRDVGDYLLVVWIGLAVTGMAVVLTIAHLGDNRGWATEIYGCMAIASAAGTAWAARLAWLVKRLPQLLESDEDSRAFAVGTTELGGRKKRVAVMATNKRLIIAAPHRQRPRIVSQGDLAGDDFDVRATDGVGAIKVRADGTTLAVRGVPHYQALNLAAVLGAGGQE